MLKVLSNLKNSFWRVIIIVILLCVQATTDLALPEYTSKIVNIGIQNGGIENAVPKVISKKDMEELLIFTNEDNEILDNYTLVGNSPNKEQEKIIHKYLGNNYVAEENTIYILKENKETINNLSKIMSTPLMEMTTIKNKETENQIKEQIIQNSNMPETQKQYLQSQSLIDIIKNSTEEQRQQILKQYSDKIDNMQESIKEQAAIASVKQVYKNLGVDTDKLQNNYILIAGIQMLGIAFITMVLAVTIMLLSSKVAAKLGKTLRDKVFKKVINFSNKELSEFSTASLITRSTNDIQQIQQLMTMLFRVVVYAPIIGIGGFIKVLTNSDNQMAWIVGVAILAILVIVGTLFIIVMPKFKKLQELIDRLNQVAREILTGLPVIRAFNKENKEEARFEMSNQNLMKANIFVDRAMSMMMPLLMLVMNSIAILIVWVGGHNVDNGNMQVGDMMAFIQYTMQIVMAFLMISMISIMLPRAAVSARRINEVLETKPDIIDPKENKKFDMSKKGLVEFKNVSFRYPDADTEVLSDINFTANPGETTAIIGSTGSGKSTIVNLLPRFYDVTGGELLVDGINIKEVSQKELREIIGLVPQKGILFSGTIESNIKYSNQLMSNEQMEEAAQIAQATEFIESKDKKYQEPIAQGGSNVSGGQKQRLAIARAIAKDPEIFIFDDSFSALDFKTDSKLREALMKKTKNKTVIIVAQRISTIMNAEKIVVLEEGKVVGIGKHNELMKNNETYRQIALSQLSEDELKEEGGE
ncbi:MAG: ATP-binding cassette domain-containing protein [Clostridia bacterium]|nr:ATP-binding cassette domain-containing protein [Clostridia bacterium]